MEKAICMISRSDSLLYDLRLVRPMRHRQSLGLCRYYPGVDVLPAFKGAGPRIDNRG